MFYLKGNSFQGNSSEHRHLHIKLSCSDLDEKFDNHARVFTVNMKLNMKGELHQTLDLDRVFMDTGIGMKNAHDLYDFN